jgi:nucleotide-binding universal stress UspA family protein
MNRFGNILCVVAPDSPGDSALDAALALAADNDAALTVLDAVPALPSGGALPPGLPSVSELQAGWMNERRQALESRVGPWRDQLDIHVEEVSGRRFLQAIRMVLRNEHDLVLKTAENPDWANRLLGSDDMHLLRKCPCPVWLTRPNESQRYHNILAAVDFDPSDETSITSDLNRRILELSASIALRHSARYHLVHVWDAPAESLLRRWSEDPDNAGFSYVSAERERHHRGMERIRAWLDDYLGPETAAGLDPQLHTLRGDAGAVIPGVAERTGADLTVMGTVARTGIAGLFMGNTAETVLEQLRSSVLAVKPPGFVSPVQP